MKDKKQNKKQGCRVIDVFSRSAADLGPVVQNPD